MEYGQERIATLHRLTDRVPEAPTDRAAVVVPMTEREYAGLAAERVLSELERLAPDRVVVALRAPAGKVAAFCDWLAGFDLPLTVLWCNGPGTTDLLGDRGLNGAAGKGRDVWLALGTAAATHEYVVVHDADARTYEAADAARLLFPLARGYDFAKGYYARVENGRLYGRLFRLFYAPLVRALADENPGEAVLDYLGAFRYALAGEFAVTADLARSLRVERHWGLEVGTLGEAFEHAGFDGTAQVDLGRYEHDHRAVSGPTGLSDMSEHVAAALFRAVENHGVEPDYATLPARYRETAAEFVSGYAADAAFNGLDYDPADERGQVETYAEAISAPDERGAGGEDGNEDARLPAWTDADLSPKEVLTASRADVADVRGE
ncbi:MULTISPECIES: glycosyl transferase family 2 [Halorussus]|uniref:glycosyl transferase family 2 n=1 Tax=Halorussus TaxID=1070314 RepID=UPI0020A10E51|nr:glycosyl transferase family 2 [Halorussus vallis]USZ75393.1 glycosyl transferase family 2 [Halorussus vallis]